MNADFYIVKIRKLVCTYISYLECMQSMTGHTVIADIVLTLGASGIATVHLDVINHAWASITSCNCKGPKVSIWVSTMNFHHMSSWTAHALYANVVVTQLITRVVAAFVCNYEVSSTSIANEVWAAAHVPLATLINSVLVVTWCESFQRVMICAFDWVNVLDKIFSALFIP